MAHQENERAAYHEAGHAVVATHLGFPVEAITIIPEEEEEPDTARKRLPTAWLFCSSATEPDTLKTWSQAQNQIVVLLAGGIAAHQFDTAIPTDTERDSDLDNAAEFMGLLARDRLEQQALDAYLTIRAENTVRTLWPAIRATATALLARGTVSGDELGRLLLLARVPIAFTDEERQWLPADPADAAAQILASDASYLDIFWHCVSDWLDRPRPLAG